jgi:hypothetical protein
MELVMRKELKYMGLKIWNIFQKQIMGLPNIW